jgi:hypothetical protein
MASIGCGTRWISSIVAGLGSEREPVGVGLRRRARSKYGIAGARSRRITEEHRLVYQVLDKEPVVLQARYHYERCPVTRLGLSFSKEPIAFEERVVSPSCPPSTRYRPNSD